MPPTQPDDDELFATRFELRALADSLAAGVSERWVDGFVPLSTALPHRRRYAYAATLAPGRRVLDISCGAGCGAFTLAAAGAREVVGLDVDLDAIRYARWRYGHERCRFESADVETWLPDGPFDLVVSFETIEHLHHPEALLATLKHALARHGEGLISTPMALSDAERPTNPFHVQEWTLPAFVGMLEHAGFAVRRTWFQGVRRAPDLPGRIYRRLAQLLGRFSAGPGGLVGEELVDSLAPYRRQRLAPKFQMHLIAHRD